MVDRLLSYPDDADTLRRLRRLWWALAVLYGFVVIALAVYLPGRVRPSSGLVALSGGLVAAGLAVVGVAVLLNSERLRRARNMVTPLRSALVLLTLAGLFGFGLGIRPEFVYGLAGVSLAATVALALVTFAPTAASGIRSRWWVTGLVIAVVAVTLIRAYGLETYPQPDYIDEPWNLSWSVTYLQTGQVSEIQNVGEPGDATYYTTHYIPRWALPVAGWLRLVGVGLWHGRLFNLLLTLPLAFLTALAARNLYGRSAALFAGGAVLASGLLMPGLRLRHDIGLALTVVLSLWVYSAARKRERSAFHLFAGLAIGLGGFAHYHALGFAPMMLVALYLPGIVSGRGSGRLVRPMKAGALYLLGLLVGFSLVALVQVVPDVATFLANRAPRNPSAVGSYLSSVAGYIEQIALVSWYDALLIAAGFVAACLRLRVSGRREFDASLILLMVLGHLTIPALSARVREIYLVPLVPVYALLVGTWISEGVMGSAARSRGVALIAGLCFLIPAVGQTTKAPLRALLAGEPVVAPPPPAAAWVLANVSLDHSILTENYYYLWLYEYPFISPHATEPVPASVLDRFPSRTDFWLSLEPDIIILDPGPDGYVLIEMLSHDPSILAERGYQLVATVDGQDGQPTPIWARER